MSEILSMTTTYPVAKRGKAEAIASYLPFTLFFPIGVVYAGTLLFLVALLIDGDYRARWLNVKTNPIFRPVLVMSVVFLMIALYSNWHEPGFWATFWHYQTYLFLLLFISLGAGAWQDRAMKVFIAGAVFGATVYYLTLFGLVPAQPPFTSYAMYAGNKSILLGMLLAIAAGLLFYELCAHWNRRANARTIAWTIASFAYICGALLFITQARTGYLIFMVIMLFVLMKSAHLSRRSWGAISLALVLLIGAVWQVSPSVRQRVMTAANEVQNYSRNMDQRVVTSTGNRLQMYRYTLEMIKERPLQGFGIGSWMPVFKQRYGDTLSDMALTPHNDYLLYTAEGGLIGLGALLFVWLAQLRIASRMRGREGMWLYLLTVTIMVAGLFNAILRDAVFGMAMMILLSIPLAGASLSANNRGKPT